MLRRCCKNLLILALLRVTTSLAQAPWCDDDVTFLLQSSVTVQRRSLSSVWLRKYAHGDPKLPSEGPSTLSQSQRFGIKGMFLSISAEIQALDVRLPAVSASSTLFFVYGSLLVLLVVLVGIWFKHRGFGVCLTISIYLLASATMMLTVKNVFVNHNFHSPALLTCMHCLTNWVVSVGVMVCDCFKKGERIRLPTVSQFVFMIIPTAVFTTSSIVTNNMALLYASTSFVEMISCCTPLCTAFASILLGLNFNRDCLLPLCVLTTGMLCCIHGALQFSSLSLALCVYSSLARSMRNALTEKVMSASQINVVPLRPVEVLAWGSPVSFLLLFMWSVMREGAFQQMLPLASNQSLMVAVLWTCINACILNFAQLFAVKEIGGVFTATTSQANGVFVILGDVALFGTSITGFQACGYLLEMMGITWYSRLDQGRSAAPSDQPPSKQEVSL